MTRTQDDNRSISDKDQNLQHDGEEDEEELEMPWEVQEELKTFPKEKDYLKFLPPIEPRPFRTPLIERECSFLESRNYDKPARPPASDLANLKVELPPLTSSTKSMSDEELKTWSKCFDQLKIKMEYRQRQLINLELLKNVGLPGWKQLQSEKELVSSQILDDLIEAKSNNHKGAK